MFTTEGLLLTALAWYMFMGMYYVLRLIMVKGLEVKTWLEVLIVMCLTLVWPYWYTHER